MSLLPRSKEDPWQLKTAPGTAEFTMHTDTNKEGVAVLVCTVGKTVLHYDARCLADLHAMLKKHGDWMDLGGADEQKSAKDGTVEAWGRSADNPIGGWYGLKKGLRGRFGVYIPPSWKRLDSANWSISRRTTGCGRSSVVVDHFGFAHSGRSSIT
jgi:hypothetical protein